MSLPAIRPLVLAWLLAWPVVPAPSTCKATAARADWSPKTRWRRSSALAIGVGTLGRIQPPFPG